MPVRKPDRYSRRGYVLLVVLAVMVLMVTALSALSKTSLKRAVAAVDAKVRLQQRLGADSIEAVLLPQAGAVFERLEEAAQQKQESTGVAVRVPTQLRDAVSVGGVTFDVLLADEDAKLNLNSMFHAVGLERTRQAIGEVAGPVTIRSVRLLPATDRVSEPLSTTTSDDSADDGDAVPVPPAFRSWGEVFDLTRLGASVGNDAALPNLTSELTCWGSGSLNVKRASDAAISQAAACVLSASGADRLVSRYRENPAATLGILVQQEGKTESERIALNRLLGESSTHFSLWIDSSAVARRATRTFSVFRKTDDGSVLNERFAF